MYEKKLIAKIKELDKYKDSLLLENSKLSPFTYTYLLELKEWVEDSEPTYFDVLEKIFNVDELYQLVLKTKYELDKKYLKTIIDLLVNLSSDISLKARVENLMDETQSQE